jgi:hypothetical protein
MRQLLVAGGCGLLFPFLARAENIGSETAALSLQTNGDCRLTVIAGAASLKYRLSPINLQLLSSAGTTSWLAGNYSSVQKSGDTLHCLTEISTPNGSVFQFSDDYRPGVAKTSFALTRRVVVRRAAQDDAGFLSCFSLAPGTPSSLQNEEVFIPGIWYAKNAHVPSWALGGNLSGSNFIIREDRMPLPLVMLRHPADGATVTLIHAHPDGATCLADCSAGRVVDSRIQAASLGIAGQKNPALVICFPGSEGDRSCLTSRRRASNNKPGWSERFHPVQTGVKHTYEVVMDVSVEPDFHTAMHHAWRAAYALANPQIVPADIPATYEATISLLSDWSRTMRGAAGLPFRLSLPGGQLEDQEKISYQMGFVGQQLPLAYHLLRYGLMHSNELILQKGEAMVNFWADNSLTPQGLPKTWFDTWPEPHWRDYNTFLRVAGDGMLGAAMAYDVMKAYGRPQPQWLRFCTGFGNWLVAHQAADGSWGREFRFDGTVANASKFNSSNPIHFLILLHQLTQDQRYLAAAVRAGDWCWKNIHRPFCYVGGTADNPNVTDKEAGFLALDAFLALHDATGDQHWLDAAIQAADFTETWAYCWNIPIPADDPRVIYPVGATTTGFSLIAAGHSGSDLFLAGAPFLFYRLYVQTGDAHYADVARLFLYNTRQSMDLNGSRGYGHTGLCTEALSLAPPRGHGVNTWLPWISYNMIEPLVNLQNAYQMMDTPTVTGSRLDELRAQDNRFSKNCGLLSLHATAAPSNDK